MAGMLQNAIQAQNTPCLPELQVRLSYEVSARTLERLREQNACPYNFSAFRHPSAVTLNSPHAQSSATPRHNLHQLCVLQWNCDSLATKFHELADVLERNRIDVALIEETNLGQEDPTPQIRGFNSMRRDRDGSGTGRNQGGGLMVNIHHGFQYSVPSCVTANSMELKKVIIHLAN